MRTTVPTAAGVASALLLTFALVLAGCSGDDGGGDPEADGPRKQAVERLVDFGLDEEQASCLVDELGAETVVATGELTVLTEGDAYQQAAEACLDAG